MSPQLERQTHIFVVRIWREYLTGEHPVLRGEVEDLALHERYPFADMHELERIVSAGFQPDGTDEPVNLHQAQS